MRYEYIFGKKARIAVKNGKNRNSVRYNNCCFFGTESMPCMNLNLTPH